MPPDSSYALYLESPVLSSRLQTTRPQVSFPVFLPLLFLAGSLPGCLPLPPRWRLLSPVPGLGPLPKSKAGSKYLLTVICKSTRHPAAFPLCSIKTKPVLKALTLFMTVFGVPKVVKTDQGSNFMSRTFAQVVKQLKVKHQVSSANHPESQGAR